MIVTARPVGDINIDAFADLTPVVVTGMGWTPDGLAVTFASDLSPAEVAAVKRRMRSRNVNEETLRARAEQALVDNRTYLLLAPPSQSQAAQQITALTRQNNGIIRQLLGLLDGTD